MDREQQTVDNVAREERDIDKEVRLREWNVKRKENKVREARYNKVIQEIYDKEKNLEYLEMDRLRGIENNEQIRALIKVRCGNMRKIISIS